MHLRKIVLRLIQLQLSISALPMPISAQSLSPAVISSGGNFYQHSGLTVSQTFGELSLTKTYFNNLILTQGFQQPEIILNAVQNTDEGNPLFVVYPNPADTYLNIIVHFSDFDNCNIDIIDVDGRMIHHHVLNHSLPSMERITLNTSEWVSGLYSLTLHAEKDGRYTNTNRKIMILRP